MSADRPDHTADPEQPAPAEGFGQGQADPEAFPEDEEVGTFAEGQAELGEDERERHKGRFSEGQEDLGEEDPEKHIQGRYDEGQEGE